MTMQKSEPPQHGQTHHQPAAKQSGGMAVSSPQGDHIAQLDAMMDSSPRHALQRKIFEAIHNSPHQTGQRKKIDSLFGTAQRAEVEVAPPEKFETAQRIEEESLQGKFLSTSPAQLEQLPSPKPNNTGLPDSLKSGIENLSGLSMDNVQVHYNSSRPAQLNAHAYAQGTDIHVAPGQEKHLPHEAWHVVQQAQGRVQPTMQMKIGVPVNDDTGLEHEADVMGAKAVQMTRGTQNAILGSVAHMNVIQRAITLENFSGKAIEFNKNHEDERDNIEKVNFLLAEYSRAPTIDLHEMAQAQMLVARNKIETIHNNQAALLGEYLDEGSNGDAKKAFLKAIIPEFANEDADLFNGIAGKLQKADPDQIDEEFEKLKGRYLSFIVQGLGTKTGKARLKEFGGLLGERNIKLGVVGGEFGAGFAEDQTDVPKAQKQEQRLPLEDQELLQEVEGNIPKFIERRFGKMGDEERRTPNDQVAETGDLAVYLEKYQKLFPMYIGQQKEGNVAMYTAPLYTALHHETGHLVNYLKGVSGGKNRYKQENNDLKHLTDEEEVHNISIDRYSDKALSGELGLPARIAHGSYMGLDVGRESFSESEVHGEMTKWNRLTGQKDKQQNPLRDLQSKISNLAINDGQFHARIRESVNEVGEWLTYLAGGEGEHLDRQRMADAIAWCLDKLEHKVYDRLEIYQRSPQHALIKTDAPELVEQGQDLDAIQVAHRKYIAVIVEDNLHLWVPGSLDERNAVNEDWQRLLANNRGIRIDPDAAPEFKTETQANIARLLSRTSGRKLVNALMAEDGALEISTPAPSQVNNIRIAFQQQGLSGKALEAEVNAVFGGQAGPKDQEASSAVQGEGGLVRGTGSGSTMGMRTGNKDSEGVSLDRHGQLILSPNFIELGHEMIHALHNIRGANVKSVNGGQYQGSPWDNMSEHSVIEGTAEIRNLLGADYVTENQLRDDHNLGKRFGHSTDETLVGAIHAKLLAIANKPGWNTKGGIINDVAPDGIVKLRILLAAQPVNWPSVYNVVHGKIERYAFTKFFNNVSETVTTFYSKIDAFYQLYRDHRQDTPALRSFLDSIKNYNPV